MEMEDWKENEPRPVEAPAVQQPVPLSNEYFYQLPPELWDLVLKHLDQPQDVFSSSIVNIVWRNVLKLRVEPIIFQMAFPLLLPYLSVTDVLRCTQVCKSWNKSIDTHINAAIDDNNPNKNQYLQQYGDTPAELGLFFWDLIEISSFMKKVLAADTSPMNPIVYRKVRLFIDGGHNDSIKFLNYTLKLKEFFENCGSFVAELVLYCRQNIANPVTLLQMYLNLVPNLRILNFIGEPDPRLDINERDDLSLPPLPQLKVLGIYFKCPRVFQALLTNYGGQLSQLEIREPCSLEGGLFAQVSQITTLKIELKSDACAEYYLRNLPFKQLILSTLIIDVNLHRGSIFSPAFVNGLVSLVNNFPASITTFKLTSCDTPDKLKANELLEMRVPKCKVIITNGTIVPTIKFLEKVCPAVEQVELCPNVVEERNCLQDGTIYGDLYCNHNFWTKFPKIKIIGVTTKINILDGSRLDNNTVIRKINYSRKKYNEKCKSSNMNETNK